MTADQNNTPNTEIGSMIADYMEKGFLENIIDMFKHDASLYELIGKLIQDERVRVRVGVTALMEEMRKNRDRNISKAVPNLLPLLENSDPVVRGDAANLLGIAGDRDALPYLEKKIDDENADVSMLIREAIGEIKQHNL